MAILIKSINERRLPLVSKRPGSSIKRGTHRRFPALRRLRSILYAVLVVGICVGGTVVYFLSCSYVSYAKIVDARLRSGYLTSRAGIYAAPRTLRVGQSVTREGLVELLRRAGYVETNPGDASDVWSGSFVAQDDAILIQPRRTESSFISSLKISLGKGRITELTGDGISLADYTLEPETLTTDASVKGGRRSSLAFRDIPAVMVQAITSIEDRRFFEHPGLDLLGVGRAILRNLGDERIGQGGSTITQQLVKNTYLSPERTLRRKYAEAMLAFTLEKRLSKEDIFALYANEV
jgi:penicillin-binding protein 1B